MTLFRLMLTAALAAGLAGCESAPVREVKAQISSLFQANEGDADLKAGIGAYENGSYNESARRLQSALDAGLGDSNQVRAHKYLAFIHCQAGRERQCRDEFRAALDIDPSFELAASEAGHPIWGPVFRSEKARR
ncbi:MAG: TssQ family T6SS-associated lipoprotein [Betaproteobacteria bacterium]|nr:TssQ family T6SS-associated lipoprotein [Betaproteobacteria bacterium]